jgi:hypothetical protein
MTWFKRNKDINWLPLEQVYPFVINKFKWLLKNVLQ